MTEENNLLNHLCGLLESDREKVWSLEDAVDLCRYLEIVAPDYGAHVALTGGCLYKDGMRKDADIMFYRIRQVNAIDEIGLLNQLSRMGFNIIKRSGWVVKAKYNDKPIDFFFPEEVKVTIEGKCLDDQYPAGDVCPTCHKERVLTAGDSWVHKSEYNCNIEYPSSGLGIHFNLLKDPKNHNIKFCPICKNELRYNIDKDCWVHKTELSDFEKDFKREMNPNFIGIDKVPQKVGNINRIATCRFTFNVWSKNNVPANAECPVCKRRLLANDLNYYHPQ